MKVKAIGRVNVTVMCHVTVVLVCSISKVVTVLYSVGKVEHALRAALLCPSKIRIPFLWNAPLLCHSPAPCRCRKVPPGTGFALASGRAETASMAENQAPVALDF